MPQVTALEHAGGRDVDGAVERLGVLGGTFDPVHVGHIVAAVEARAALDLDRVLLVVAAAPWQKEGQVVAPAEVRLAAVRAAVEGIEGLEASDLEITRGGPTFSADTVAELGAADRELFLIVGSDVAARIESWRRVDEVRQAITLVVVERCGEQSASPPGAWRLERVQIPRLDVSSTDLRERMADGRPIEGLVPAGAVRVLREAGLYTPR
jgi:nicotinate-nucleotide adenylyltransferase